jgi:hypothetical protein
VAVGQLPLQAWPSSANPEWGHLPVTNPIGDQWGHLPVTTPGSDQSMPAADGKPLYLPIGSNGMPTQGNLQGNQGAGPDPAWGQSGGLLSLLMGGAQGNSGTPPIWGDQNQSGSTSGGGLNANSLASIINQLMGGKLFGSAGVWGGGGAPGMFGSK